MSTTLSLIIVSTLQLGPAILDGADKVARAEALMKMLAAQEFDAFCAEGDDTIRAKFPPAAARQMWVGLRAQLGEFESIEGSEASKVGVHTSVMLTCRFSSGTLKLRVVLDAEDRMAGLWVDGIERQTPYEAPAYVDHEKFAEVEVTVSAGSFPLPGTLSLPKAGGPHSCVVLVHGSGPNDRDETVMANKPFRDLAGGLASRGVAVLRYEKRTKEHPRGLPPAQITLEWETIDDALAAVKLARGRDEIDARRVFVLGHSLGGMAAPLIAQRDADLAGIIMMAASARPILDVIDDQLDYLAAVDGTVTPEEKAELDKMHAQIKGIRAGNEEALAADLVGAPGVYWHALNGIDNVSAAAALKIPVMVVHGERDYQVSMKDLEIWKQRLSGRANVTFAVFDKLNHLMIAGEGKSAPSEYNVAGHVDAALIDRIATWVRQ